MNKIIRATWMQAYIILEFLPNLETFQGISSREPSRTSLRWKYKNIAILACHFPQLLDDACDE